jgi:molybdopterin molybdotransferase
VLITGNELLEPGRRYERGKIYNSNGPLLTSLLAREGVGQVTVLSCRDSMRALQKTFQRLLAAHDVIFLSGGVSVGDYDLVDEVLRTSGCTIHFDQVSIQPGKPFTFATRGKQPIFAFPGNPVSVFVAYRLFALPALRRMSGAEFADQPRHALLKETYQRRRAEREAFIPVRWCADGSVETVDSRGSGDLMSLCRADSLMIVPRGVQAVERGAQVEVMPFDASCVSRARSMS